LIGVLGALIATNQSMAVSNVVKETVGVSVSVPDSNDPVEKEFQKLMEDDDAAEADADQWIKENDKFAQQGAGVSKDEIRQRIRTRLDAICRKYEDFLKRHPDHARARVAYASLLHDMNNEEAEMAQLEQAGKSDPNIPSIWNNMANYYTEHGPTTNAFICYEKAIALNSNEPVYFQNFAAAVYLFRPDAVKHYHITEQQVFSKALELYERAMKLDPTNFPLATDLAESYYGIKPVRIDPALRAWTNALSIAHDDVEREGVYIHLARFKMYAGRFAEARDHLRGVTNEIYQVLKERVTRNLDEREAAAKGTNQVSGIATNTSAATNMPVAGVTTNASPSAK
jgi:tetratricopeptide (TPR) repeat protein